MDHPSKRAFLTSLLSTLNNRPQVPNHNHSSAPQANPLRASSSNTKTALLTLHVIFPSTLLPALDLLDRGLVTRFSVIDNTNAEPYAVTGGGDGAGAGAGAEAKTAQGRPAQYPVYSVRSAARSSTSSRKSGGDAGYGSSTGAGAGTGAGSGYAYGTEYEVRPHAWSCSCPAFVFAAFPAAPVPVTVPIPVAVAVGRFGAEASRERGVAGDGDGDAVDREGGHGMRAGEDGGGVTGSGLRRGRDRDLDLDMDMCDDDNDDDDTQRPHNGDEHIDHMLPTRLRTGLGVGGLSLGDAVPVCKHLLACVLVEQAGGVFGGCVVEREVSLEEFAGWAAGWGG